MKEEEIARNLDEIAASQIPRDQDMWQAIRTRLDTQAKPLTQQRTQNRGWGLFIVPAIVLVLVMVLLYAAVTAMAPKQNSTAAPAPAATPATPAPARSLSVDEWLDGIARAEKGSISSFHGVLLSESRNSPTGAFNHSRSEQWYVAPDKMRYDYTVGNEQGESGTIMQMRNGASGWLYDSSLPNQKTQYKRYPASTPSVFVPIYLTARLGDRAKIESMYNVKLLGSTVIAGRAAQALELIIKPTSERPAGVSAVGGHDKVTIWIDSESFYVLRLQTETLKGERLSTEGFESFELNGSVDPAVFEVSPPEK